jgi:putative transposase
VVKHIHRTAVFTIHNPTKRVQRILDQAFTHYNAAFSTILHHFSTYTVEELYAMATYDTDEKGNALTSDKQLVKNLFGREAPSITATLTPLESSMRESLKFNIADTLLSYIEITRKEKQQPSYPTKMKKQEKEASRMEALDELSTIADDREQENDLIALIQSTRKPDDTSIAFTRVDAGRNCGLFYNPETKRFYARLFIISPKSHLAKPLDIAGQYIDIRSGSVYVRKEDRKEGLETFGAGKGSIMVPLEMGRWHEDAQRFTETAFLPQRHSDTAEPAIPVSAKLVKTEKSYQLHVSFRFPKPEKIKPLTLLGVDRGITCLAAGAVVSLDGKQVLEEFIVSGKELGELQRQIEHNIKVRQAKGKLTKGDRRRGRIADQHVHLCANKIVELAKQHQAQIIMEDLDNFATQQKRPKGQRRSNFNAMLPRRQYQKLQEVINAKLTLVGLPPIRTVAAAFTSQTCTKCGHISTESRSKEDRTLFCCVNCQHTDHADSQAGINIARKVHWLALRGQEKQREIADANRTSWATYIKDFCSKL